MIIVLSKKKKRTKCYDSSDLIRYLVVLGTITLRNKIRCYEYEQLGLAGIIVQKTNKVLFFLSLSKFLTLGLIFPALTFNFYNLSVLSFSCLYCEFEFYLFFFWNKSFTIFIWVCLISGHFLVHNVLKMGILRSAVFLIQW